MSSYETAIAQGCSEDQAFELSVEWGLTLAFHGRRNCGCMDYLLRRKKVLLVNTCTQARAEHKDPADILARFVRGLHEKLQKEGQS